MGKSLRQYFNTRPEETSQPDQDDEILFLQGQNVKRVKFQNAGLAGGGAVASVNGQSGNVVIAEATNNASGLMSKGDKAAIEFNILNFGAISDATYLHTGSITAGTNNLTCSGATFFAWDIGKKVIVCGAGANELNLETSIATIVSGTAVTLATNAVTTVTAAEVVYGSNNTPAIQSIIDTYGKLRDMTHEVLGPGTRVRIYVPDGKRFLLWNQTGQHHALMVSWKDDIEFYGGGTFVFNDCRCIHFEYAKFPVVKGLHFDGVQYNKMKASPSYSCAIYTAGAPVTVGPSNPTWSRNRSHRFEDNQMYRVKFGIGCDAAENYANTGAMGNWTYTGVESRVYNNKIKSHHILGSVGICLSTSDNKIYFNIVNNTEIGVLAPLDLITFIGNHQYNSGGYSILYAKGQSTSGSDWIELGAYDSASPAWSNANKVCSNNMQHVQYMVGTHVQLSSGMASPATWYKILEVSVVLVGTVTTYRIRLEANASSTQAAGAITVKSHGMNYGIYKSGSGAMNATLNEFDAVFNAHICLRDNTGPLTIQNNGFGQWGPPDFKFIDCGYSSPTLLSGLVIKENNYYNGATDAVDNERATIEFTNAITEGARQTLICDNTYNLTGKAVSMVSIGLRSETLLDAGTTDSLHPIIGRWSGGKGALLSVENTYNGTSSVPVYLRKSRDDEDCLPGDCLAGDYGGAIRMQFMLGGEWVTGADFASRLLATNGASIFYINTSNGTAAFRAITFDEQQNAYISSLGPAATGFGGGAAHNLLLGSAATVPPTTPTPDHVHLYASDLNGAGTTGLNILTEDDKAFAIGTKANGTGYHFPDGSVQPTAATTIDITKHAISRVLTGGANILATDDEILCTGTWASKTLSYTTTYSNGSPVGKEIVIHNRTDGPLTVQVYSDAVFTLNGSQYGTFDIPVGQRGFLTHVSDSSPRENWTATATKSLPSVIGNSGKYLTNDGTTESWASPPGNPWGATGGDIYYPANVCIGAAAAPDFQLQVVDESGAGNRGITSSSHYNGTAATVVKLRRSRGSKASPAAIQQNDYLGSVVFDTYVGGTNGWKDAAVVQTKVVGTVSDTTYAPATDLIVKVADGATGNIERLRVESGGPVRPGADNTQDFGSVTYRWATMRAGTGAINTSDAREKTPVFPLTDAELAAAKDLAKEIGCFQFLSAVQIKNDAARQHIGMTVQRAIEILSSYNLDPFNYAFICHDQWEEKIIEHPAETEAITIAGTAGNKRRRKKETKTITREITPAWTEIIPAGDRYGFRTDELLLFISRGFEERLARLELVLNHN